MKIELKPYEHMEEIPRGTLQTFEIEMKPYPDHRTRLIRVWLPETYDGIKRFPVIYMQDGQNVYSRNGDGSTLDINLALDTLRAEGIDAMVVAIDTADTRVSELTPPYQRGVRGGLVNGFSVPIIDDPSTTPIYAEFIVKTLKPLIDENFCTLPDMENTCVGGISAGASCSYYCMLEYPEVFGKAIVCSPGFPMFDLEKLLSMLDEYDFDKLKDHRIAFYNGDQTLDVTSLDYVLAVYRKFKEKGMDRNHSMFILDTRQCHYEYAWGKYMPELLRFLFAKDNSEVFPPSHDA